jgi:predicted NBD/HSP70 family sugar kinase
MNEEAAFLEKGKMPTPKEGKEALYEALASIYHQYQDVKGIGISLPGVIDPEKGYAYTSGALNYYNKTYFVKELETYVDVPVTIGNDAKCAANAEIGFGVLQDVDDAAVVVLGTGIGGCLIKDHKVITGKHFSAGEASVIMTDYHTGAGAENLWCNRCGIIGLLTHVQEALGTEESYSGEEIFAMANDGNEKVIGAINSFTKEIAVQLYNIHTWFDSEKIAIGGGISAQPLLFELLNKNIDALFEELNTFYYPCVKPTVVKCQYGNDANLVGALYQHLQSLK